MWAAMGNNFYNAFISGKQAENPNQEQQESGYQNPIAQVASRSRTHAKRIDNTPVHVKRDAPVMGTQYPVFSQDAYTRGGFGGGGHDDDMGSTSQSLAQGNLAPFGSQYHAPASPMIDYAQQRQNDYSNKINALNEELNYVKSLMDNNLMSRRDAYIHMVQWLKDANDKPTTW